MQVADLGVILIKIPTQRYVSGAGWVGSDQHSATEGEFIFRWPTASPENIGLHATLAYDMEITFSGEAIDSLPNLFRLLNGLPVDEEVEIPDFGYEGRNFYLVGRKFVVTGICGSNHYVERQLAYIIKVLSEKSILIATRRPATAAFTEEDTTLLRNIWDGNSRVRENHGDALRNLWDKVARHVVRDRR